MKVVVDMCCEVIVVDGKVNLFFEEGNSWFDEDFDRFDLEFEVVSVNPSRWPEIALTGSEENIRKYLDFYGWDDIDFIIEECQE